jgi:hypothetical protein
MTMDDDRAREGLEHLQTAAREMIAAARAMLDVAESLLNDPTTAATVLSAVGSLARLAAHAGGSSDGEEASPTDRIERIRVS